VNYNLSSYDLLPGEVHVWKVGLASTSAEVASHRELLSTPELARAGRFHFERDEARFISCRASLRILLSCYLRVPADCIQFRIEPYGKPALANIADWQFNVAHSRDLAAIAISRRDFVGVDIELIDPGFPRDEVAPETLAPDEIAALAALPEEEQPARFFALWTFKEALLKALGSGFSLDPRDIRIGFGDAETPTLLSGPAALGNASLHPISLQAGFASALAVLAPVTRVSLFTL
jgi:4'-phosphopantetheinyl transferase